ncbi:MAG: protein-glutamate O-methyltransferase CheR [Pyrinomonadaceae bacterium]
MNIEAQINQRQFERISRTVYDFCGIKLNQEKQNLVKSRLTKRLHALNLNNFDEYLDLVGRDREEFSVMIDSLTTNKTDFFREMAHFEFLRREILPDLMTKTRRLRIWSAACSSGEEPYSISMLLHESLPDIGRWDIKILATDISSEILGKAHRAEYDEHNLTGVSKALRQKYFSPTTEGKYEIRPAARNMVRFARLNLMGDWKMKGPFDLIFCRNVMIYFDKPTQSRLVNRFYNLLAPDSHLFIGHSESLNGVTHPYRYIQPAIYLK